MVIFHNYVSLPEGILGVLLSTIFLILLLDIPQSLMLRGSSGSGCPMRSREASPLVRRPNDHDEKIRETYGKHMEKSGMLWK